MMNTEKTYCNVPSHVDYQAQVNGAINLYQPLKRKANPNAWKKAPISSCKNILLFLEHIFGEQLSLGLDYLQLLYLKPTQRLPILLLHGAGPRGKTTFINLVQEIFGENVSRVNGSTFLSNVNSDWTPSLVLCQDSIIYSGQTLRAYKFLTTLKSILYTPSRADYYEIDFFAKVILTTYWPRGSHQLEELNSPGVWSLEPTQVKTALPDFPNSMYSEIPAFLGFLSNREMATSECSRLWFCDGLLNNKTQEAKA